MSGYRGWFGSVVTLGLVAIASSGCSGDGRGHALYASDRPLAPQEVAKLSGYVHHVDGKDVSSIGGAYELLPGCHVIDTPTKWGRADGGGGVVVTTGVVTYTLPMRANHRYSIWVDAHPNTGGPTGTAQIRAKETDVAGALVREFSPSESQADLDACARCAQDVGACEPGLAQKQ